MIIDCVVCEINVFCSDYSTYFLYGTCLDSDTEVIIVNHKWTLRAIYNNKTDSNYKIMFKGI